jgi:hypothetical protein
MTTNYPTTETGSIDMLGDEFPNPFQPKALPPITLDDVARFVCDDVLGSPKPRPPVTAWRGADMDAYYFDEQRGVWLHCITGDEWNV